MLQILPVPAFNIINGGSHAGNALAMQVRFTLPENAKAAEVLFLLETSLGSVYRTVM